MKAIRISNSKITSCINDDGKLGNTSFPPIVILEQYTSPNLAALMASRRKGTVRK